VSRKTYRTVLIDYGDVKSLNWSSAAKAGGLGRIIPQDRTPILTSVVLLRSILRMAPVDAVCLRYLNDYPQWPKTVVRLFSELCTVLLCKVFRIQLLWICHNVDRETAQYFPRVSSLRRRVIARFADRIFVTDELLKKLAAQILQVPSEKICVISFGMPFPKHPHAGRDEGGGCIGRILAWSSAYRKEFPRAKLGFWIGEVSPKKIGGLKEIQRIIVEAEKIGENVAFVIVGDIQNALNSASQGLLEFFQSSRNVLFLPYAIDVPPLIWGQFADFVWKPLDDLSVPMTAYNACTSRLPICVLPGTFLAEFVEYHRIGLAFDGDSVISLIEELDGLDDAAFEAFLADRSWANGAYALLNSDRNTCSK